ncbi:hypothetical protein FKP32DRAFT_173430 [Trametes sanguinea]|nr:hypothetical protein FKP32DRAFT_173430 [Trametes sanguinea]
MPFDERRLLLNGLQPSRPPNSDLLRSAKRRRTDGLNDRFDRMIQTVNVMHGSSSMSRRSDRRRIKSTSSATDHGAPQTPVVAYSKVEGGRPGHNVLKMQHSQSSAGHSDMFDPAAFRERMHPTDTVPPWLTGTLSSLDSKHPLRLLVPAPDALPGGSSPSALESSSDPPLTLGVDESPFAFSPSLHTRPMEYAVRSPLRADMYNAPGDSPLLVPTLGVSAGLSRLSTKLSVDRALRLSAPIMENDPMRPFSTPGPSSSLGVNSPVRSHRPLWLPGAAALARATIFDTELRREDSPPLRFVPFSTPGPLRSPAQLIYDGAPLRLEKGTATTAPLLPHLDILTSRSPRYAGSPEPTTREATFAGPTLEMSASLSSMAPRGLTSSASDFIPFTAPGPAADFSESLAYSPSMRPDFTRSPSPQTTAVPCNDIDFRWCRFNHTRIAEHASSSPMRFVAENSEETFWSQPAPATPNFTPKLEGLLEPDSPTDSMHDLRRASTLMTPPRRRTPQSRQNLTAIASPPLSQKFGKPAPEDNENPFIWIVPPRDVPIAPPSGYVVQDFANDSGRATTPVQEAPVPPDNDGVSQRVETGSLERRRRPPSAPTPRVHEPPSRSSNTSPAMAVHTTAHPALERYDDRECLHVSSLQSL